MRSFSGRHEREAADRFADLLDRGGRPADDLAPLLGLARSLRPPAVSVRPDFRTALRDQLVAEAAARIPAPRAESRPGAGWSLLSHGPRREPTPWVRVTAAGATAFALVVGGGVTMASTSAVPGDPLYGLKRQVETLELSLARSDQGRGAEHLEQAETRLAEAEALVTDGGSVSERHARLAQVLTDWSVSMERAGAELARAYVDTGDAEPMRRLAESATEQYERLAALLPQLPTTLRDPAQNALDTLADLRVTSTAVLAAGSDAEAAAAALAMAQGLAAGDGWAVSRLVERATSADTVTGATGPGAAPAGMLADETADFGGRAVATPGPSGSVSAPTAVALPAPTTSAGGPKPVQTTPAATATPAPTSTTSLTATPLPTTGVTSTPIGVLPTASVTVPAISPLPSPSVSVSEPIPTPGVTALLSPTAPVASESPQPSPTTSSPSSDVLPCIPIPLVITCP